MHGLSAQSLLIRLLAALLIGFSLFAGAAAAPRTGAAASSNVQAQDIQVEGMFGLLRILRLEATGSTLTAARNREAVRPGQSDLAGRASRERSHRLVADPADRLSGACKRRHVDRQGRRARAHWIARRVGGEYRRRRGQRRDHGEHDRPTSGRSRPRRRHRRRPEARTHFDRRCRSRLSGRACGRVGACLESVYAAPVPKPRHRVDLNVGGSVLGPSREPCDETAAAASSAKAAVRPRSSPCRPHRRSGFVANHCPRR